MAEKRTRRKKTELQIEGGEVIVTEVPEDIIEVEALNEEGKPVRVKYSTPKGEAIYEFSGNCFDCNTEKKVMPVFHCVTLDIRADAELGNQLAGFWNDGVATPLCMEHYNRRLEQLGLREPSYTVLERRW